MSARGTRTTPSPATMTALPLSTEAAISETLHHCVENWAPESPSSRARAAQVPVAPEPEMKAPSPGARPRPARIGEAFEAKEHAERGGPAVAVGVRATKASWSRSGVEAEKAASSWLALIAPRLVLGDRRGRGVDEDTTEVLYRELPVGGRGRRNPQVRLELACLESVLASRREVAGLRVEKVRRLDERAKGVESAATSP